MLHLVRNRGVIDEVCVWVNTWNEEDLRYIATLPKHYGPWVKLVEKPTDNRDLYTNIFRFWVDCTEKDTIYFRLDDDIVYLHPGYFEDMVRFRLEHPEYFLVLPQIWHNGLVNYFNQRSYKVLGFDNGYTEYVYNDATSILNSVFAKYVHEVLLFHIGAGRTDELLWPKPFELELGQLISISSFCFFGEDFASFGGRVGIGEREDAQEEERILAHVLPIKLGRTNVIYGRTLASHFAFSAQRQGLEQTDLLPRYYRVAEEMLANSQ